MFPDMFYPSVVWFYSSSQLALRDWYAGAQHTNLPEPQRMLSSACELWHFLLWIQAYDCFTSFWPFAIFTLKCVTHLELLDDWKFPSGTAYAVWIMSPLNELILLDRFWTYPSTNGDTQDTTCITRLRHYSTSTTWITLICAHTKNKKDHQPSRKHTNIQPDRAQHICHATV